MIGAGNQVDDHAMAEPGKADGEAVMLAADRDAVCDLPREQAFGCELQHGAFPLGGLEWNREAVRRGVEKHEKPHK